jgi:hypothetical protein
MLENKRKTKKPPEIPLRQGEVRAKRINTPQNVTVESKTLGTDMAYVMGIDNLSRSGLLLNKRGYTKTPFQVNTLLELNIDPKSRVFSRPISCLGKVVRTEAHDNEVVRYGIQILEIDDHFNVDFLSWLKTREADKEFQLPPSQESDLS